MNDLKLEELLQSTDAMVPAPKMRSGIADRARRRARGRSVRNGIGAFVIVIAGAGLAIRYYGGHSTAVNVARLRTECVRLDAEARLHEMIAERLLQAKPVVMSHPGIDALLELDAQRSYAAAVLVARGEQLQAKQETRSLAMEKYRRVIELFPETDQAATAAKHLKEIST